MDSFEDPSNLIVGEELLTDAKLMAEEKKNKPNEETENELNEHIDGSKKIHKRRRPSEEDSNKEDLSECKRVKKSPRKIKPNKRGRPAGKDKYKEDLPESKKAKKSPKKMVNLKIMSINKNGKKPSFTKVYIRHENEICIFCQEEYHRETPYEAAGQDKPDRLKGSICRSCRACLEDEVVMKEIRDIIKKEALLNQMRLTRKLNISVECVDIELI